MSEKQRRGPGRESPQGPGWWRASDGLWYPPELKAASIRAARAQRAAKAGQNKGGPKAAGTSPRPQSAPSPTSTASATPRTQDAAARQSRSETTARAPRTSGQPSNGGARRRPLTAEEQIAARQKQAAEQAAILAPARQKAALRALASIGFTEDPVGVGSGTARGFDAREVGARLERAAAPTATLTTAPRPPVTQTETLEPTRESPTPEQAPRPLDEPVADTVGPKLGGAVDREDFTEEPTGQNPAQATRPTPTVRESSGSLVSASRPADEEPFMEVKGSALNTDIDRIGEKILIFADRVELRDRGNALKELISYVDLAAVEIHKRIMGPTLVIRSRSGTEITAKGLRPETASGAKAMIEKHARRARSGVPAEGAATATQAKRPSDPPVATPAELARMLAELHRAGLLSDAELAEKERLLASLTRT
ncbi:MAG: hypothetical protein KatS3mg008_1773 [Acidimicrobiales bacterium]|nr:MAG: hypothetical protein KatS3mg008_1773 [Acidimicrobiales bacterium]